MTIENLISRGWTVLPEVLPEREVARFFADVRGLFSRPLQDKLLCVAPEPLMAGYEPHGRSLDAETGEPNPFEAWNVSSLESNHMEPSPIIASMAKRLHSMAVEILHELTRHLQPELATTTEMVDPFTSGLQLIHYLNIPGAERGQSLHSDVSLLTLLPRASAPGLIVLQDGMEVEPEYVATEVCVLVGLALSALCGIDAPRHSVDVTRSSERFSYPYFLNAQPRHEKIGSLVNDYRTRIFGDASHLRRGVEHHPQSTR